MDQIESYLFLFAIMMLIISQYFIVRQIKLLQDYLLDRDKYYRDNDIALDKYRTDFFKSNHKNAPFSGAGSVVYITEKHETKIAEDSDND